VLRGVFDAWSRGDFTVSVPLLDADTVLVIGSDFPEWGTYTGPEEIAAYMREQHGFGRTSGVDTEVRYHQAFTFRGGKLGRIESILRREDALAAAGLEG
jgi:ketosteroid isomerase-like protein